MSAIEKLIEESGEDILINGLVELVGEEIAIEIYNRKGSYIYYIDISNYVDLKNKLLDDDYLWDDSDFKDERFYYRIFKTKNEDDLKALFSIRGWKITTGGLAIFLGNIVGECKNGILTDIDATQKMEYAYGSYEIDEYDIAEAFKDYAKKNDISIDSYLKLEIQDIIATGRRALNEIPWTEYLEVGFDIGIEKVKEFRDVKKC